MTGLTWAWGAVVTFLSLLWGAIGMLFMGLFFLYLAAGVVVSLLDAIGVVEAPDWLKVEKRDGYHYDPPGNPFPPQAPLPHYPHYPPAVR